MNIHSYQVFGDNTKEVFDFCKELVDHAFKSGLISRYCLIDDIIDQSIFVCDIKNNERQEEVHLKVSGMYENWDLPTKVKRLFLIDRPDIVVYNIDTEDVVCAAEFTSTVSVGNSQFQRQARTIQSAIVGTPFMITIPEVQMDRSQMRFRLPEAETIANHFILSYKYRITSIILLEPNPYSPIFFNLKTSEFNYKLNQARTLKYNWFMLRLFNNISPKNYNEILLQKEVELFQKMGTYLESTQVRERFPLLNYKIINRINYLKDFVNYLNGKKEVIDSPAFLTKVQLTVDWLKYGKKGKVFNKSTFKKGYLSYLNEKYPLISIRSYQKGAVAGVCFETKMLIVSLSTYFKVPKKDLNNILNSDLPTIVIAVLGYKKSGTLADPSTGEIAFFSQLLAPNFRANVITAVFGPLPHNCLNTFNRSSNKLMRALNQFSNAVIFSDKLLLVKK